MGPFPLINRKHSPAYVIYEFFTLAQPSVPISLETLSSNSLMSRAKEVFNVSRLVIIIEARESIASKGGSEG
jgi:hypothetical protein